MLVGRIKTLDVTNRMAVVTTEDGQDIAVTFPAEALIEVAEPETMGTMGGELEDLHEGFYVEIEVAAHDADGSCICVSLVSVS